MTTFNFGALVDELRKLQQQRINDESKLKQTKLAQRIENTKIEESRLKEELIQKMQEVGTYSARGELASFTITEADKFAITDYAKLQRWVIRTGHTEVFEVRPAQRAIREIIEEVRGKHIPGITATSTFTTKLTPVKTK